MSTRSAIIELGSALSATRARLAEVRQSTGDHPANGVIVVVDLVQDACDDLDGWLVSAMSVIDSAKRAATSRRPAQVAERLNEAAVAVERALATYVTGVGGADSISRLRELAADQGRAWQEWAWTILDGLGPVWTEMTRARAALDQSWFELVEHLLRDPVDVVTNPTPQLQQASDVLTGGQ